MPVQVTGFSLFFFCSIFFFSVEFLSKPLSNPLVFRDKVFSTHVYAFIRFHLSFSHYLCICLWFIFLFIYLYLFHCLDCYLSLSLSLCLFHSLVSIYNIFTSLTSLPFKIYLYLSKTLPPSIVVFPLHLLQSLSLLVFSYFDLSFYFLFSKYKTIYLILSLYIFFC